MRRMLQLATVLALGTGLAAVPAAPAMAADPVGKIQQVGLAPFALYVVKDLGGGAYWNVTTNAIYAVDTASVALVSATTTGSLLLAEVAANGRDLLLLINGAVLEPVGNLL
ncbi:MAG: hypothetical protein M3P04_03545 [Actinomycetota bacterium]|nr:hypothetical protein [Actinomycetota bacterium]